MVIAIAGFLLAVLLVFARALFPPHGYMIFGDDIIHQYYFYREYLVMWLRRGVIPWWNPYMFSGVPFIANAIVNIWYPPNWLYFIFPLPTAFVLHLTFHVFWAGLGMYVLMRSLIPSSRHSALAAWISGLIFGLSGFFMARTWGGHVDVIAAASWMPWVVWAFFRLITAPGDEIFLGTAVRSSLAKNLSPVAAKIFIIAPIVFAFQLLAGYQTMAFFTVISVGIMVAGYSIATKSVLPVVRAGIAGIFGVLLAAIQLLPEAEFFRASIRTYTFPYSWISYGSWTLKSLWQLINPFFFGNPHTYNGPLPNFIENSAFVGVAGLVLAILGIIWIFIRVMRVAGVGGPPPAGVPVVSGRGGKPPTGPARIFGIFFFVITIFGIWVSLGPNAPVDLLKILWRIVPMYHYLRIPPRHLILVVFGLAGLAGFGFEFISRKLPRIFTIVIAGAVIIEMVMFGRGFIELTNVPDVRIDTQLVVTLHRDTQPYRVLQDFGVWLPPRDALEFDGVLSHGIFSVTGYDPSILRNYYEFIARASGKPGEEAVLEQDVQVPYLTPENADAIDFLNVKYILVPPSYDPFAGNGRYRLIEENTKFQYRLYENLTVKPRFFLENSSCGSANITSYTPNEIRLNVSSLCNTRLLSSEVWYPGWTAKVDGKNVNIGKLNNTFRTLFVSNGNHTIIYSYTPTIYYEGMIISGITVIVLLIIWKRRQHYFR